MEMLLWSVVGLSVVIVIGAGLAERRRSRMEGMARVGWMPWSGIIVAALFTGVAALALVLHR